MTEVCKICGKPRDFLSTSALCTEHRLEANRDAGARWRAAMTAEEKDAYLARVRLSQLKSRLKRFNLTIDDYNRMLMKQGYCCAICLSSEPGGKGGWHIDHDHVTGRVRGLLCHNCNIALGNFKDSVQILNRAINYLGLSLVP